MKLLYFEYRDKDGVVRNFDLGRVIKRFLFPKWAALENEVVMLRAQNVALKESKGVYIMENQAVAEKNLSLQIQGHLYLEINNSQFTNTQFNFNDVVALEKGNKSLTMVTLFGQYASFEHCVFGQHTKNNATNT